MIKIITTQHIDTHLKSDGLYIYIYIRTWCGSSSTPGFSRSWNVASTLSRQSSSRRTICCGVTCMVRYDVFNIATHSDSL
ncbi:unnamed protein product [Leptidea sinapis]|uniref:Uncharacterized protein n=1 Tax=Leptidea sinapis TaxID=189913 RepID=A0A5E4QAH9_9NEOP|nr:unnamed protein product [Leptidea sinapis]